MGARKHVVVWPACNVFVKGKAKTLKAGDEVPDGVSDVELDNLRSFGAITGVSVPDPEPADEAPAKDAFDPEKGGNIDDTLAYVGSDPERAAQVLELEKAKGEKARPSLVTQLEALVSPQA